MGVEVEVEVDTDPEGEGEYPQSRFSKTYAQAQAIMVESLSVLMKSEFVREMYVSAISFLGMGKRRII